MLKFSFPFKFLLPTVYLCLICLRCIGSILELEFYFNFYINISLSLTDYAKLKNIIGFDFIFSIMLIASFLKLILYSEDFYSWCFACLYAISRKNKNFSWTEHVDTFWFGSVSSVNFFSIFHWCNTCLTFHFISATLFYGSSI